MNIFELFSIRSKSEHGLDLNGVQTPDDLSQEIELLEANFANSGKTEIVLNVKKNDKNYEIVLHSFDKIFDRFIKTVNVRSPEVKTWFESNFKNWVKNEMDGYEEYENLPKLQTIKNKLYPDLNHIISLIIEDHPQLSKKEIMDKLPEFIKKNPNQASVFGGGRLFAFKFVKFNLEYLIDYLEAIVNNKSNRDYLLMPDNFFVNNIKNILPVDAFKKSIEYHEYLDRVQSKITQAEIKTLYHQLKPGKDYEILQKNQDNTMIVKALTGNYVRAEGKAMKHCVGTYADDVEHKRTTIYSFWNKNHTPEATFELDNNTITQLKGPHNGPVHKEFWESIIKFILKHKLNMKNDFNKIGLTSSEFEKLKHNNK